MPRSQDDSCVCGSGERLADCCLGLVRRLRDGWRGCRAPASPFDDLRSSAALLLWGLCRRPRPGATASEPALLLAGLAGLQGRRIGGGRSLPTELSRAARTFWGAALGRPDPRTHGAVSGDRAARLSTASGDALFPDDYGEALCRRTWAAIDPGTRTWMLASVPPLLRRDPFLGELALDWLLWDAPWLRGRPAADWLLRCGYWRRPVSRRTVAALLRSRVRLLRLDEPVPAVAAIAGSPSSRAQAVGAAPHGAADADTQGPTGRAPAAGPSLPLRDVLTGHRLHIHTPTPAWRDPELCLVLRTYRFGRWHLAATEGLLLPPQATTALLGHLRDLTRAGPAWPDPDWSPHLRARAVLALARFWSGRRLPQQATSPQDLPRPDGKARRTEGPEGSRDAPTLAPDRDGG